MALPKQVQAQLAEVEELEEELNAQGETKEAKKPKKGKDAKAEAKLEIVAEDTEEQVPDEQPTE